MNELKKKQKDDLEIQTFRSEHWSISHRNGFNSVSRYSKTFHIPDDELVELKQLIGKWEDGKNE